MAVEPKMIIARILADLNLAVRYGITIHILCEWEILAVVIYRIAGNIGGH